MFFEKRTNRATFANQEYANKDFACKWIMRSRDCISSLRNGSVLLIFFTGLTNSIALADSVQLTVVPDKCISLRKGQNCFQRVHFRWQSNQPAQICLWRDGDSDALQCWNNATSGQFRYQLNTKKTAGFYLVSGADTQQVVARQEVRVTWVYNSRSSGRTRWRLF